MLEAIEQEASNASNSNQPTPADAESEGEQTAPRLLAATAAATDDDDEDDSEDALVEQGVQILELVTRLAVHGTLQRVLTTCADRGIESHLGSFLVPSFLHGIDVELRKHGTSTGTSTNANRRLHLTAMSRRLCRTGNRPVEINGARTLGEFSSCHTGPNLRWETIGIMLALMG